jgi:uncharacterized membrane protein YraQ (UPF0718 family)
MGIKLAALKSIKALGKTTPAILSVVLFIGLISAIIPKSYYAKIFIDNAVFDSIVGAFVGSIAAGNPVTSYILGGEMLNQGISLIAITAFIVAWVTVGIIQLPAEVMILGKRFAFLRNATAFVFAIIVALITVLMLAIL